MLSMPNRHFLWTANVMREISYSRSLQGRLSRGNAVVIQSVPGTGSDETLFLKILRFSIFSIDGVKRYRIGVVSENSA